jgi:hypothetical protein
VRNIVRARDEWQGLDAAVSGPRDGQDGFGLVTRLKGDVHERLDADVDL